MTDHARLGALLAAAIDGQKLPPHGYPPQLRFSECGKDGWVSVGSAAMVAALCALWNAGPALLDEAEANAREIERLRAALKSWKAVEEFRDAMMDDQQ